MKTAHPDLTGYEDIDLEDETNDNEEMACGARTFLFKNWRTLLSFFVDYFGSSNGRQEADKVFHLPGLSQKNRRGVCHAGSCHLYGGSRSSEDH